MITLPNRITATLRSFTVQKYKRSLYYHHRTFYLFVALSAIGDDRMSGAVVVSNVLSAEETFVKRFNIEQPSDQFY